MRALIFALLANGKSVIRNVLNSPDVEAMCVACRHLGAQVECFSDRVEVHGVGGIIKGAEDVIQAGNSGLVLRFIGGIAALGDLPIVITGDHSIRHRRPVIPLLEALNQVGVEAFSMRGEGAPILVKGPLRAGNVIVQGEDSQPVSALLIAAAFAKESREIFVINAGEKPWVNLTLEWFKKLGIPFENHNFERYKVIGNARIDGFEYTVPADLSTLCFPLAAAILTDSELEICDLDFSDPQGDQKIISILQQMGANIEVNMRDKSLKVRRGSALTGGCFDVNECVDMTPIMAVVGCFAKGKTRIQGAHVARTKECDRISSIVSELKKMGARIEEHADGFTVEQSLLKGATLGSHADHRIALSLAIAGLGSEGETIVEQVGCVKKTYPGFCQQLQALGACISEKEPT